MNIEQQILDALRQAIKNAGGKPALAKKLGLTHSVINRFENGTCHIANMTVGTLEKIFPNIKLNFNEKSEQIESKVLPEFDMTTQILLSYWKNLAPSKQFEFLAKLADYQEKDFDINK